ncbi:amidohydrolase family protein [Thermodesulfobacteriota bacterium]
MAFRAGEEGETGFFEVPPVPITVDTHMHLFPEPLFRAIRGWFDRAGWKIPYPWRTEEVLDLAARFRVSEIWALAYAHKPGVSRDLNRWMGETQAKHLAVRGFASVHPGDDDPVEVVREAIEDRGLWGLKLHAEVQALSVDDPRLDGVFDLLEERSLVAVLHCADAPYPAIKPNLNVDCLERRLKKNPGLKVIVAHLGAWQTERTLELTADYAGLYLEVSFTRFPGAPEDPRLKFDSLGRYTDRLLFGSDFPNITFSYAGQVKRWLELDWVRAEKEAFFGGTAKKLIDEAVSSG